MQRIAPEMRDKALLRPEAVLHGFVGSCAPSGVPSWLPRTSLNRILGGSALRHYERCS